MKKDILLGVNIDHIATLREARGTTIYPDPLQAAFLAEEAGADGITLHMREDRRHIQERDVRLIRQMLETRMNLELAVTNAMLDFAHEIKPHHTCLVPEKREELTTEGGLDVCSHFEIVKKAVQELETFSEVSLFIDPNPEQIKAAFETGAKAIELHTGAYAEAKGDKEKDELKNIIMGAEQAHSLGLIVNAGHGLHYHNVKPIAAIPQLNELNIGHAIIARALFTGLKKAVSDMRSLMQEARR